MADPACRFCSAPLSETFVDLGMSPPSNSYRTRDDLSKMERFYPLHVYTCGRCLLVQLQEFETPEQIFSEYAYFSSCSDSWLEHCRQYVESVTKRFGLGGQSSIIELASNDGYLLQYFKAKGVPVLGIEPAKNVAKIAIAKGIPTETVFFGVQTARDLVSAGKRADLLIGNNVLAHVPELNDFVAGMKIVLSEQGVITMEFPHLMQMMRQTQFDTIYHEHFSYYSFGTVQKIFAAHGLRLFDVEELPTHGGSLRIYGCHAQDGRADLPRVAAMLELERAEGLDRIETYGDFGRKVQKVKQDLLEFLIQAKRDGKRVVGYGAPAKGNTLLNYCGIRTDFIDFTVDRNTYKQGRYLPGTNIPIREPESIRQAKPDYVFILPWNIKDEVMEQVGYIRQWGGRFVVPIPRLEVLE